MEYKLTQVVKSGNLEEVKSHLIITTNQFEINQAFGTACEYGYLEVVKLLLENGAQIHSYSDYALHWACSEGHVEVVKLLISEFETIPELHNAFICACNGYYLDIVKVLKPFASTKSINYCLRYGDDAIVNYINNQLILDKLNSLI
jgi:ankyrin repeat protein